MPQSPQWPIVGRARSEAGFCGPPCTTTVFLRTVERKPIVAGFLDRVASWLAGPTASSQAPHVEQVRTKPTFEPEDPRLPDTTRPRVARLLSLVSDIEARSVDDALLVSALTEVRQMRDSHLPQLVTSYAEIPAAHRADIFRKTGKSASYNLNAAVDRMIQRLETLSSTMAQDDIDSFADNLRFIEHRYGSGDPSP